MTKEVEILRNALKLARKRIWSLNYAVNAKTHFEPVKFIDDAIKEADKVRDGKAG